MTSIDESLSKSCIMDATSCDLSIPMNFDMSDRSVSKIFPTLILTVSGPGDPSASFVFTFLALAFRKKSSGVTIDLITSTPAAL